MATINIYPIADAAINMHAPTTNYGMAATLHAGVEPKLLFEPTYYHETLMRFDLSAIPTGNIITSAIFHLFVTSGYNWCNHYAIRNIPIANRTWTETGITWNNKSVYDSAYPNIGIQTAANNAFVNTDVTSYIRDQYNLRINADFNIGIISPAYCAGWGGVTYFASKEDTNIAHRPYLQVIYESVITATDMIVNPTSCLEPCSIIVTVTWKNNSTNSQAFTPQISVDGNLYSKPSMPIPGGASTIQTFTVTGLMKKTYSICPVPN